MIESFLSPERLWLLTAAAALLGVYVLLQFRRSRYTVRFANLTLLDKLAPKRPGWRRHLAAGLLLTALTTSIVAFAKPVQTTKVAKERSTVILAIDVSLSMAATDVKPSRLEAAQSAATAFVESLPPNINLALISFAGTARLLVPPTQDRDPVTTAIDNLKLDKATAIGDAVKLSLDVIANQSVDGESAEPNAAIVLISDGETTVGLPTADSIPLANEAGVPVTTIAYGTPDGTIVVDEFGDGNGQLTRVPVNVQELAGLAEGTGGQAYTAESASDLSSVYSDLGSSIGYELELTEVGDRFVLIAIVTMIAAAAASLRWSDRLV